MRQEVAQPSASRRFWRLWYWTFATSCQPLPPQPYVDFYVTFWKNPDTAGQNQHSEPSYSGSFVLFEGGRRRTKPRGVASRSAAWSFPSFHGDAKKAVRPPAGLCGRSVSLFLRRFLRQLPKRTLKGSSGDDRQGVERFLLREFFAKCDRRPQGPAHVVWPALVRHRRVPRR